MKCPGLLRLCVPILVAALLLPAPPAWASKAQADAGVQPGNITIALKNVLNLKAVDNMILDMIPGPDGRFYISTLHGKIVAWDPVTGKTSTFFDMAAPAAKLTLFNSTGANGLYGFAFHPDFSTPGKPGYHKIYTWGDEDKTATSPQGGGLNGLPDFWHPEIYQPSRSPAATMNNPPLRATFLFFNSLREWTVNTGGPSFQVDPSSTRALIRIAAPGPYGHNGAPPHFGPDGYLYFSLGDGGGNGNDYSGDVNYSGDGHTNRTGNGQDLTNIFGKVLRIDPFPASANGTLSANGQYRIPADNPFADGAGGKVREIYAYGFRNPWKIDFDDRPGGTGKLYVADVGQYHREEIDDVVKGGNYGWAYLEGSVPLIANGQANVMAYSGEDMLARTVVTARTPPGGYGGFNSLPPLAEYKTRRQFFPDGSPQDDAHLVGDGLSVTLGFVYRGKALPALDGLMILGDYSVGKTAMGSRPALSGRLFYLNPTLPEPVIYEFKLASGSKIPAQLLGFCQDPAGEPYIFFDNGDIFKIVPP